MHLHKAAEFADAMFGTNTHGSRAAGAKWWKHVETMVNLGETSVTNLTKLRLSCAKEMKDTYRRYKSVSAIF